MRCISGISRVKKMLGDNGIEFADYGVSGDT